MKTHIEIPGTDNTIIDVREVVAMNGYRAPHNGGSHYDPPQMVDITLRSGKVFTFANVKWDVIKREWVDYLKERDADDAKPKELRIRITDTVNVNHRPRP